MEKIVPEQEVSAEAPVNVPPSEVPTRVLAAPPHPPVAGMRPEDWESVPSPRRKRR